MANRLAPTYPILVAEWQRNGREIIRIARDRFNKREDNRHSVMAAG